jgi:SnoaL-like protein
MTDTVMMSDDCSVAEARRLRGLAAWYRAYAERAANPAIWDARLRTAEDLEAQASGIERSRRNAVSDRIHELLYRNLQEVFGEGDAACRCAAIGELYTEDCELYAPPGVFVGHEALDKFAGDLRATHPHFVYTPHGEPQALHNAGRLAWGSGPSGEPPDYTGMDVIIVRDGKIAALYVFLDSTPS